MDRKRAADILERILDEATMYHMKFYSEDALNAIRLAIDILWQEEEPMTAVEYLSEKARMCDGISGCENCPLCVCASIIYPLNSCDIIEDSRPEDAVEVVRKWSKENPKWL